VPEPECPVPQTTHPATQARAERSAGEAEKAQAELVRAEDERRRLEERVAVLQRDLDLTEDEVVRTKAKLKGLETKAAASSALAEAHIMMRRLAEDHARPALLSRCQELLDRAEQQISDEN
jgi:hypothetical protein